MGCNGIIAEYNPFHNGHRYHLERARALSGCDHVIVAMSGSFTQRGDIAMFDKRLRAKWALENGADMVLELPTAFALSSAERFARGGVALLHATGLVTSLCFGAECTDLELLLRIAEAGMDETEAAKAAIERNLELGLPHPAARARALAFDLNLEDRMALFNSPNNILAVEYLRAICGFAPKMRPLVVGRAGAMHDSSGMSPDGIASASAIRAAIGALDLPFIERTVPPGVYLDALERLQALAAPCEISRLSDAILYALRRMDLGELEALADVAEGLHNAIFEHARQARSYAEFLSSIKSKRYTLARLRRIALSALLGITKDIHGAFPTPSYIRVLGVRRASLGLLSDLSNAASLPVVTGYCEYRGLSPHVRRLFDIDLFASDLFAMASPEALPAVNEFKAPLLIV